MPRSHSRAVAAPAQVSPALLRRLVKAVGILAGVLCLVLIGIGGFLTYRILTARNEVENVTPSSYLLTNYVNLNFTDARGNTHAGWLLYGLRGAPALILCPGYNSNRAELLSLATLLQQNRFNVYVFNFSGLHSGESYTNLGVRETSDVLAAIQTVIKQKGVNPHRVALYGTTTGGFAALAAAEANPSVAAVAVDGAYEQPMQMFNAQLDQLLGGPGKLFRWLADTEFRLVTLGTKSPPITQDLSKLANRPKLFIVGTDLPLLAAASEDLYRRVPEPKRLLVMDHTQPNFASDWERKEYENQIINFFLQHVPLRAD